jgi:hypothetical protein
MTTNIKKPTWTNVKSILITKEPVELLMLIKDLYALNKNNKTFIDARYQVSNDVIPAGKPESSAMDGNLPCVLPLDLGTMHSHPCDWIPASMPV